MKNRTRALLVLAFVATVAVYGVAFALSTTRDRPDQIDTDALVEVVSAACIDLRTTVDALPPLPAGADADDRRERVAEQSASIDALVARVRGAGQEALDADQGAEPWLADWEALRDARDAWAQDATGPFVVPTEGENARPLDSRIESIGVAPCVVPEALTVAP